MKSLWTPVLFCGLLVSGSLHAQTTPLEPAASPALQATPAPAAASTAAPAAPAATTPASAAERAITDPNVVPASGCCSGPAGVGASAYGCSGNNCVPGRRPCNNACNEDTLIGRLFGGVCDGVCCPDPCYEPAWILEANAAFFQDSPRPVTQTRIRWDHGVNYGFPDSAEFFWAQAGKKGPTNVRSLNYDDLTLYQEVAAKGASVFFELPYRTTDPRDSAGHSGIGDINLGAKSVLLDRELLLVSLQFRTFIPSGNFSNGIGTGHTSLEPSLLAALKLSPSTYLQTQLGDWIPIGGTPGFAGSVFHYHFSLNQNLCHRGDFMSVVGTLELNGYSFRGMYTDFPNTPVGLGGSNYVNAGPGIRIMFCDRCDIGVGMAFDIGNGHGPAQIYRTEFRVRF